MKRQLVMEPFPPSGFVASNRCTHMSILNVHVMPTFLIPHTRVGALTRCIFMPPESDCSVSPYPCLIAVISVACPKDQPSQGGSFLVHVSPVFSCFIPTPQFGVGSAKGGKNEPGGMYTHQTVPVHAYLAVQGLPGCKSENPSLIRRAIQGKPSQFCLTVVLLILFLDTGLAPANKFFALNFALFRDFLARSHELQMNNEQGLQLASKQAGPPPNEVIHLWFMNWEPEVVGQWRFNLPQIKYFKF